MPAWDRQVHYLSFHKGSRRRCLWTLTILLAYLLGLWSSIVWEGWAPIELFNPPFPVPRLPISTTAPTRTTDLDLLTASSLNKLYLQFVFDEILRACDLPWVLASSRFAHITGSFTLKTFDSLPFLFYNIAEWLKRGHLTYDTGCVSIDFESSVWCIFCGTLLIHSPNLTSNTVVEIRRMIY